MVTLVGEEKHKDGNKSGSQKGEIHHLILSKILINN